MGSKFTENAFACPGLDSKRVVDTFRAHVTCLVAAVVVLPR